MSLYCSSFPLHSQIYPTAQSPAFSHYPFTWLWMTAHFSCYPYVYSATAFLILILNFSLFNFLTFIYFSFLCLFNLMLTYFIHILHLIHFTPYFIHCRSSCYYVIQSVYSIWYVTHTDSVSVIYFRYITPPFVFSSNSGGSIKLPDDGRLLPKHVGANT
jgi:hypothetical protein